MTADRRALTIVITFLGLVMFGFWVAHACAVVMQDRPMSDVHYRAEEPSAPIERVLG
jgi:hypothetical protein